MKKRKLNLNELKVKSFVTGLKAPERNGILGGKPEDTFHPDFCAFQSLDAECDSSDCEPNR